MKHELFEEVEKAVEKVQTYATLEDEWSALVDIVQRAAETHYAKKPDKWHTEEALNERKQLLREQRRLRLELQGTTDER